MSRKIQNLVTHPLLRPLVQPRHIPREPAPLALPRVFGRVALVGAREEREVGLRGDLQGGVRGAGGGEGGEDAGDGGEFVVLRHPVSILPRCFSRGVSSGLGRLVYCGWSLDWGLRLCLFVGPYEVCSWDLEGLGM